MQTFMMPQSTAPRSGSGDYGQSQVTYPRTNWIPLVGFNGTAKKVFTVHGDGGCLAIQHRVSLPQELAKGDQRLQCSLSYNDQVGGTEGTEEESHVTKYALRLRMSWGISILIP
ncbi:hypothetical protein GJ744_009558 [Endocarpon pusillum]|uniref:Uncharacterized protein n=1 Tax=Endocarpon pusillum TaxID=364733 RepID=A0A8H7AJJ6_9EURO|nr:hypothetical protein GJ744_009558 [Endocarpon pusillum]